MTKTLVASVLAFVSAISLSAFAQESREDAQTTTLKAQDILPKDVKNQPGNGEDVDTIITNKKMRAESGSKSRWSIGSTMIYSGGSIEKPLADERPNLAGGSNVPLYSNLGGTVGIGYRLTTTDRLGVDVGVNWYTPTTSSAPPPKDGQSYSKFDAANPDVLYSHIYKWGDAVQSVFTVGPTLYTASGSRALGYVSSVIVMQNNIIELGHSGVSLGLVLAADYYVFDKNDPSLASRQTDYDIQVSPFVEYTLSDRLNLRTVFNYANWEHLRSLSDDRLYHDEIGQSVGLGISVTRDIFLYPNVQFVPYNITHLFRADQTNVALQANLNVF